MKILRSFLLLAVCFCTTTVVYAQELKPEIAKPVEIKIPANANNKPSAQAELKPQLQVATETATPAATPSPLTRKENVNPEEKVKLEVKTLEAKDITTPGGEEGRKKMAGKTTRPTTEINNHSTIDPKPAPQPVKPATGRQQQ